MNIKIIFRILGLLLVIEGLSMLLALVISLIYSGSDVPAFIFSSLICIVPGVIIVLLTNKASKNISKREGFLIVTLVWIIFSLFGSLPYVLSGAIPNFTNAFFETMSGFSTTGATILEDVETLAHGILFWRSLTQWLGGMGIIVLSLSLLPLFGIGGMQLFVAEVPGPVPDKVSPKVAQTARVFWVIYLSFTLAETALLILGGMSLFDAICHAFTTMGSGGFSTKQASVAYWDSPFIHYVIILFMIIAGTNFTLIFNFLRGRFSKLYGNEEFQYYIIFIAGFSMLIFIGLLITTSLGVEEAFRTSLFQVASIISTTGFVTSDYVQWTPVLTLLIFCLYFFGGSTGSTGGGVKIMRVVLLLKNSYYELKRLLHPNAVIPVRFNNRSVDYKIMLNVLAFFVFFVLVFFVSSIIFMIFEPDFETSVGAVASALGNVGPGLGTVGPSETFVEIHHAGKWFLSFLMLLGRLELFTVLVLFTPSFWKR
ncbi:MAG: TrkH family potassium uptake protein [Prolixibacteraceae bacterium]|nr:TrkH family potassium uptake protein [Prolixibacteraceae bacterium]